MWKGVNFYKQLVNSQQTERLSKFKLVNLIVKQISSGMEQLEQKIRRSSKLKDLSTFRELLAYANMVRDQDQENKIGLAEPEFWAAKLAMLKNRCQYRQFIRVLKTVNKHHELKQHPKYWLINEVVNQLQQYLQKLLRKKAKGKRTAREYEVLNFSDLEKQTRKFGKIEVYIDPDCRKQYRLEDLAQFVCNRLYEQCEIEKNCYVRELSSKPMSFIGKAKEKINKISQEMFGRKQIFARKSSAQRTSPRVSLVVRQSNKGNCEPVQTPDFKKKESFSKESRKSKIYTSNCKQLESYEMLKKIHRKSILNLEQNPELDFGSEISSVEKQKARGSPDREDNIFSEPDLRPRHELTFSFADKMAGGKYSTDQKKQGKARLKDREAHILNQSSKDFAFIDQNSQAQINVEQKRGNSKQAVDLENIIKQIQMQKYDSQTFSEIDSNKQNNLLMGEDSSGRNFVGIEAVRERTERGRRKFETIKKGEVSDGHREPEQCLYRTQQQTEVMNQSSQLIYKQLLSYLEDTSKLPQEMDNQLSMSERKRNKRISRISEERSYSFSQTRPRSKSNS